MSDLRQLALQKQREWEERRQLEREEEKLKRISEFTKGWKNTFETNPDRVEFVEENEAGGGYLLIYKDEYVFAVFSNDLFHLKIPDVEDVRNWPRIWDAVGILKYYPEEPKPVPKEEMKEVKYRFEKKRLIRCEKTDPNRGFFRRLFG